LTPSTDSSSTAALVPATVDKYAGFSLFPEPDPSARGKPRPVQQEEGFQLGRPGERKPWYIAAEEEREEVVKRTVQERREKRVAAEDPLAFMNQAVRRTKEVE